MKKYNSIQDIRDEIDKIDLEIIDLISDRKDLVDEVVKLKKKDQIVDQERIDFILSKLNLKKNKLFSNIRVSFSEENNIYQVDKYYDLLLECIKIF